MCIYVWVGGCGWNSWACSVFVVLVVYCAYINVWRYVVVHVRMYTCVPTVEDCVGAGVWVRACISLADIRLWAVVSQATRQWKYCDECA